MTARVASEYAPRFQGLFDDLKAAGYNISSLGEGGYSYRNVAGTNNLSRHAFGEAVDINPRQNPWSNNFQTDLPPNINEIAKRNGLMWGGNWRKPDTMHFQVDKSANEASLALDKLATSSTGLEKGFGNLDTSATTIAKALDKGGSPISGFPPIPTASPFTQFGNILQNGGADPGGGFLSKILGGIGRLVGGIAPGSPFWAPNTTLGSVLINGYADGTESAPGGLAMVGERGREIVNLPRGSQVVPNHRTEALLSAANGNRQQHEPRQPQPIIVQVQGANGDEHVRKLVEQGVQNGLALAQQERVRGSYADEQNAYFRRVG
ncbi:M15 family metallopeptidase [Ciceribacter sp. sgz301302]